MGNEGGRSVTIFCQKFFCVRVPKNFLGNFSVFHRFQVFKKICLGEEFHDLLKKICCITVPKIFVEELFVFHIFSGIEKFHG